MTYWKDKDSLNHQLYLWRKWIDVMVEHGFLKDNITREPTACHYCGSTIGFELGAITNIVSRLASEKAVLRREVLCISCDKIVSLLRFVDSRKIYSPTGYRKIRHNPEHLDILHKVSTNNKVHSLIKDKLLT